MLGSVGIFAFSRRLEEFKDIALIAVPPSLDNPRDKWDTVAEGLGVRLCSVESTGLNP